MIAMNNVDRTRKLALLVFALALALCTVGCGTGLNATEPDWDLGPAGVPTYAGGAA
jgi:hypothetical protein